MSPGANPGSTPSWAAIHSWVLSGPTACAGPTIANANARTTRLNKVFLMAIHTPQQSWMGSRPSKRADATTIRRECPLIRVYDLYNATVFLGSLFSYKRQVIGRFFPFTPLGDAKRGCYQHDSAIRTRRPARAIRSGQYHLNPPHLFVPSSKSPGRS